MTTTKKAATTTPKTAAKPKVGKAPQPIPDLPNNPFVFEIFEVWESNVVGRKVEALKKFEHPCLKTIFIWNFDETVVSMLPEGDVLMQQLMERLDSKELSEKIEDAISKMEELGTHSLGANDQGKTTLRKEYPKFYNFIKGGNPGLSNLRRETMFINILQGLHPLRHRLFV